MWATGDDLDKLPAQFKRWNVRADSDGRLALDWKELEEEAGESAQAGTLA
jgi:hypothetical protein